MAQKKKKLDLEALTKKWYAKLKLSGFHDIEYPGGSIKNCRPRNVGSLDPLLISAKMDYYSFCRSFLEQHAFESNREKIIWEYHTEGISIRDIVDTLKKSRIKTNRDAVHKIIQKLERLMKAKYAVK